MGELTSILRPGISWRVYRIHTRGSEYHLGVFNGSEGRRPCVVLRGHSQGLGQAVDLQDSAPLIGGRSLFDLPPSEWVGKALEVGTATTSPVQSVHEEPDSNVVAALTQAAARIVGEPLTTPLPTSTPAPMPVAKRGTTHRIFVGNESHKFSSAHMTVFPDGSKERLHGHNFRVSASVEIRSTRADRLVDLGLLKRAVQEQCASWDQRLLLPMRSPQLRISRQEPELDFTLCGRHYVVPADEAILLPLDNVVTEALSELFAEAMLKRLATVVDPADVLRLTVTIQESPGQGGSYECAWS